MGRVGSKANLDRFSTPNTLQRDEYFNNNIVNTEVDRATIGLG